MKQHIPQKTKTIRLRAIPLVVCIFLVSFFISRDHLSETLQFQTKPAIASNAIAWQQWTPDLFTQAKAHQRFIILDLEAVWCHWCHVMDEKTYGHPEVKALIKDKYLPVRVDQDANPDLSSRYGDWGWPATIIFAADGTEIVKLRGYVPPERLISLLKAVIEDPSPGPSVVKAPPIKPAESAFLSKAQKANLLGNYQAVYDEKHAGWGTIHKFIHTDSMDYALYKAADGDKQAASKAQATLNAALALMDPVWGGVYQYSDKADWSSPHYEKIMWYQTQYIRHYTSAYTLWGKPAYLQAAREIHRYLRNHLKAPGGAFFTSQNADLNKRVDGKAFYALGDTERRKLGSPRVDKNIYARENGWVVSALVALANATGEGQSLKEAQEAMNWLIQNRQLPGGGYKHGANDRGGPFLGDTLSVGSAALDLYAATGERKWLLQAIKAGRFITQNFKDKDAGFATTASNAATSGVFEKPVRQIEENIQLARFLNRVYRYSGKPEFKVAGQHTMRYLASKEITAMRRFLIGIVLADEEMAIEPAHITIVGSKDSKAAKKLHAAAHNLPLIYKRIDWWDKREGAMINPDVEYPEMEKPAAFACANSLCSLPVFEPENLIGQVKRMMTLRTENRAQ